MGLRLASCIALLLLLAGCGLDARQAELCETIVPALLADDEQPANFRAAADAAHANTVVIEFRTGTAERRVVCSFAGGRGEARLALRQVTLDGMPLSFARMVFLWRAYGLTPPTELTEFASPPMSPARAAAYFLQQLINGLTLGAVLALISVGYSLIYGITGTVQFAFGEIFMIGAYLMVIFLAALTAIGVSILPAALLLTLAGACLVTATYGWSIDRLVYRPLRGTGVLAPLIAAIGLSIALREYVRLAQGAGNQWLPNLLPGRATLFDGGGFPVTLGGTQVFIVLLAVAVAAGLSCFVRRTAFGRSQRACADDPVMAALLGIDVDRIIAGTFALGAVLAALSGVVVALYYGEVDANIGYLAGFKALTAALLGGFGSISGALFGAMALGLFEAFWSGYLGTEYKDAAIFAVLILVLVFRPQGILGTATNPRDASALLPAR